MAVRNSRPRTQDNYIFVNYNGQRFMLQAGSFETKDIIYGIKKKLLRGKIEIPLLQNPRNLTILITCNKNEPLNFELI